MWTAKPAITSLGRFGTKPPPDSRGTSAGGVPAAKHANNPGLAQMLRRGTAQSHRLVENVAFIRAFLRGVLARDSYVQLLVDLYHIYSHLETNLQLHVSHPVLAPLLLPALWRQQSLQADLAYFAQAELDHPSPAAARYAERLDYLGQQQAELLVAHAYTRYLGDLSGGPILRRIAARALDVDDERGLSFYAFPQIADVKRFKQDYRARLDSLPIDADQATAIVAEAVRAFALNGAVFESLSGSVWHSLWNLV